MTGLEIWGATARTIDLGGEVHYIDFDGTTRGPRMVLVHGLGGSHLNWCLLGPRLAPHARVLAIDLAGFGRTVPYGRRTTVRANAGLLDRFIRATVGTPVILVGNSMGGMISILETARHPDAIAGLVLINPSVPPGRGARVDREVAGTFLRYAVPGVGERFLARQRAAATPRQLVQQVLDLCCVNPSAVPEDLVAASETLVAERTGVPGLDAAFLAAARSLVKINAWPRRYWSAMAAVSVPVLLLHGERDRLVPVQAARVAAARNPGWQLETLPGIGHVPQLEAPDLVAERMLAWLGGPGGAARAGASAATTT
jgi:pimeloyl-ACP methyl ester carboxylesterase